MFSPSTKQSSSLNQFTMALVTIGFCLVASACDTAKHRDSDPTPDTTTATPQPEPTASTSPNPKSDTTGFGKAFPQQEEQGDTYAKSTIGNLNSLITKLNLTPYHRRGHHGQGKTIAILDNGFLGAKESLGKRLPPKTEIVKSPGNEEQATSHGTKLAELIYGLASGSAEYSVDLPGPNILLLNTNGYTNFVFAINECIRRHVDIVLYSQVWEYGGNFDGAGFLNAEVKRATDAGILWVNAAGNYGLSTFQDALILGSKNSAGKKDAKLPYDKSGRTYVRFDVPRFEGTTSATPPQPIKITLAWNDFSDSKNYRTPRDLNLIMEDEMGREIASSKFIQDGAEHINDARYSAHAREIIRTDVRPGIYYLRVEAVSDNFQSDARIRIAIDGPGVKVLDHPAIDTILIPADNPEVMTVGASDVVYSSESLDISRKMHKPEFLAPSKVSFTDGQSVEGTSTAAAVAAGVLAVYQSYEGRASRLSLLKDLPLITAVDPAQKASAGAAENKKFVFICQDSVCRFDDESDDAAARAAPILRLADPR